MNLKLYLTPVGGGIDTLHVEGNEFCSLVFQFLFFIFGACAAHAINDLFNFREELQQKILTLLLAVVFGHQISKFIDVLGGRLDRFVSGVRFTISERQNTHNLGHFSDVLLVLTLLYFYCFLMNQVFLL